ncbi:MAG: hypothetical protein NDJ75_02975 [Thermoanaerobaculia bacterium]|nr:hypothetical protein [Thermoanaerobaculia bacterium]
MLVAGDAALAAPRAEQLAAAIGEAWGVVPRHERFLAKLSAAVDDLRTIALFESGKLLVVHETGLLADREEAVKMLGPVLKAAKSRRDDDELDGSLRDAAVGLLRVLRLHDLDPAGGAPEQVVARLPAVLFGEAPAESRGHLARLLEAALAAGLHGAGGDDLTLLSDLLRDGLPERHLMILVESAVDPRHPLVAALSQRGAVLAAGRLSLDKQGHVAGLDGMAAELARETGARLRRDAAVELARRTIRGEDTRRGGAADGVDADSAARFAAEYRKLAALAADGDIDRALVAANVSDRGQEDVFQVLDAIGDGRAGEALEKIARRLAGAEDPLLERLSIFGLLAGFARHLAAVSGALRATGARAGVSSYPSFKERVAPQLQGEIDGVDANPLKGMHAFRLHRIYLAASRLAPANLAALPARTLETERRLKGDSGDPDAALAAFVVALAGASGVSSGPGAGAGSRARGGAGGRS